MGKIINFVISLIAYFCVATVITAALILGYLRHTDQLTNDKMFRLVAVMQDIDLDQIADAAEQDPHEVPPKEPSLNELQHQHQVQDRNYEVKQLALDRGKRAFEASYQQLVEQTDRYDRIAKDWQSRLKQEQELTSQQNVAKIVDQLEQVSPDVGKKQLMMWIEEQKMDDAILLMSQMSENKLSKILKTFETPEELRQLHEIHQRILSSRVANETLEQALEELDALDGKK